MMPPSIAKFYRARLDELVKLKDDPDYESKAEEFVNLLVHDYEYIENMRNSAHKIHLVSGRLIQIDEAVKTKVKAIYEDLPAEVQGDKKLKGRLYEAGALMYWSENNRNIREACKYMFVQLECICEYLVVKYRIIDWAESKNAKLGAVKYGVESTTYRGQTIKYLKTGVKATAVWDYLTEEKGEELLSKDYIRDVKEMRDYASHGYHANTIQQKQTYFSNVEGRFEWYVEQWIGLILKLKAHLL